MTDEKKILILTADAGFGHRSAANAVITALKSKYQERVNVFLLNPLDDERVPPLLRKSQSDYDKIVRNMPELYRIGYEASDAPAPIAIAETALTVILFEVINDILKKIQPDAVLTTYPLYQAPFIFALMRNSSAAPFFTVITDLVSVHRLWFYPHVDAICVPNQIISDLATGYGIPAENVLVTGIPVNPQIVHETRFPAEIRAQFGWDPVLPTIFAAGSRRVTSLIETLNVVNHFGAPLQLVVTAGGDETLYRKLQQVEWHIPVHIYKFVKQIPEFLKASDALICKAGGLIVTEAMAAGLPMMLVDIIPGQETGNAEYVAQGGAGVIASNPVAALEALAHWFANDRAELQRMAENSRRLGRPDAAEKIADLLWNAGQTPRFPRREELIKWPFFDL